MNGTPRHVAIIGAGSIGVAFSVVFSRAGWSVVVQEPDATRREAAPLELADCLRGLAEFGLLAEDASTVLKRVSFTAELEKAVGNADLVQECAPERVELKRELFERLETCAPRDALLASSSSALPVSAYSDRLATRGRCLVAHPGNPPYLIPVIELVPASFTDASVMERAVALYTQVGLKPVRVEREVEGFVFNRLQGAVLREAYCLVRDGVASVEDVDTVVREGLGLRWSFLGPFETVDLNTRGGIASHALKMGPAYARMGAERGQSDEWTPELVSRVEAQRRAILPLDQWANRVRWRDRMLMRLRSMRSGDGGGVEPWPPESAS
ncbi:MAG: 3-hydroxyacyl-CoA dehydrogenase [Ottowia sp.]|uniref:3-hydroxyacyl-CoA dehydrogenase n=1 Tax=Ottowia sp. TaxID=1898956 RepID=UPI003C71235C